MRRYRAHYRLALVYNGLVVGIWPGAALAGLLTRYPYASDNFLAFVLAFVAFTAAMAALVMWSYHVFIWGRGQRRRHPAARTERRARGRRERRKTKLTIVG